MSCANDSVKALYGNNDSIVKSSKPNSRTKSLRSAEVKLKMATIILAILLKLNKKKEVPVLCDKYEISIKNDHLSVNEENTEKK